MAQVGSHVTACVREQCSRRVLIGTQQLRKSDSAADLAAQRRLRWSGRTKAPWRTRQWANQVQRGSAAGLGMPRLAGGFAFALLVVLALRLKQYQGARCRSEPRLSHPGFGGDGVFRRRCVPCADCSARDVVWGYILYRVFADAGHLRRPHTPRSLRPAFIAAARSLGTRAPALRLFLCARVAARLNRVGLWRV